MLTAAAAGDVVVVVVQGGEHQECVHFCVFVAVQLCTDKKRKKRNTLITIRCLEINWSEKIEGCTNRAKDSDKTCTDTFFTFIRM